VFENSSFSKTILETLASFRCGFRFYHRLVGTVMLYESSPRSPVWRFTAGFKYHTPNSVSAELDESLHKFLYLHSSQKIYFECESGSTINPKNWSVFFSSEIVIHYLLKILIFAFIVQFLVVTQNHSRMWVISRLFCRNRKLVLFLLRSVSLIKKWPDNDSEN
jgi:hypothetical protein